MCKECDNFEKFDIEKEQCQNCLESKDGHWFEVYKSRISGETVTLEKSDCFADVWKPYCHYAALGADVHIDIWRIEQDGRPDIVAEII